MDPIGDRFERALQGVASGTRDSRDRDRDSDPSRGRSRSRHRYRRDKRRDSPPPFQMPPPPQQISIFGKSVSSSTATFAFYILVFLLLVEAGAAIYILMSKKSALSTAGKKIEQLEAAEKAGRSELALFKSQVASEYERMRSEYERVLAENIQRKSSRSDSDFMSDMPSADPRARSSLKSAEAAAPFDDEDDLGASTI